MQDYLYYTTGGTCGAGTAYPFGVFEFSPGFSEVRVAQYLAFYVIFFRSFFFRLSLFCWLLYLISTFVLLSLGRYLCWWTICPRGYHLPSSQCFGTCIYLCWWTICPQGYHPPSSQCFGTCIYLCWWTICPRGYHPPSSQCFGTCIYLCW